METKLESSMEVLLDAVSDGIYVSDAETFKLLYVNPAGKQLTRSFEKTPIGSTCYQRIMQRNTPCPFCQTERFSEEFGERCVEIAKEQYRMKRKRIDWHGKCAYIGILQAERNHKLKKAPTDVSKQQLDGELPCMNVLPIVADMMEDMEYDFLVVVDGDHNSAVDYAVKSREAFFSTHPVSFEARGEELIRTWVSPEDMQRVLQSCRLSEIWEKLQRAPIYKINFRLRQKDGEVKQKQLQFTRINQQYKRFLATLIDVSDVFMKQEASKERLKQAVTLAEQASKAKSDFLARMSHDIRTPMNAILGLSRVALEEVEDHEATRKNLKKIISSGEYLLGLLNDILDLTKIEKEQLKLNPQPCSPLLCMEEILTIFHPQLTSKQIDFIFRVENLIHHPVLLDKLRYKQIWFNLISNAIKFTPKGGRIELTVCVLQPRGSKIRARYHLKDTGIGISEEFQEHLFEPFTQERKEHSSVLEGSGLGLPIVKNLVSLMGGTIEFKSKLGFGTEFIITMEYDKTEEQAWKKQDMCAKEVLVEKQILLVEDHDLNALVATKLLTQVGARVERASNGIIAIKMVQQSKVGYYDAILMDIRMPEMDGLEATEKIRALNRSDAQTVPIIGITANVFEEDVQASYQAGMNGHLAKPIDPELMYQTLVQAILNR